MFKRCVWCVQASTHTHTYTCTRTHHTHTHTCPVLSCTSTTDVRSRDPTGGQQRRKSLFLYWLSSLRITLVSTSVTWISSKAGNRVRWGTASMYCQTTLASKPTKTGSLYPHEDDPKKGQIFHIRYITGMVCGDINSHIRPRWQVWDVPYSRQHHTYNSLKYRNVLIHEGSSLQGHVGIPGGMAHMQVYTPDMTHPTHRTMCIRIYDCITVQHSIERLIDKMWNMNGRVLYWELCVPPHYLTMQWEQRQLICTCGH